MNYKEYGTENREAIILLHGGGFSWWNYKEEAELLCDRYHVLLPVLDGHGDSDRHFTTIEDNAQEIVSFIDERFEGQVLMIGGLSLGAQIVTEILSQRSDICKYAVIESAMVIPSKMTNALIGPTFSSSYSLISNRKFSKLQFDSYHIKKDFFEDYYRDSCKIAKEDMIAFMKANTSYELKGAASDTQARVLILYGEKENSGIRKSAQLIHEKIKGSELRILKGLSHGQFSLNDPERYVRMVEEFMNV